MSISPVTIFQYAAEHLPYYKQILAERGIERSSVVDIDTFSSRVPILSKEEIFGRFSAAELCPEGVVPDFVSAIVSSGTSGVFSFGLITQADIEQQRVMVDTMMDRFFGAKDTPPIIINLLAMGVSFVSSYPVIPTSVRTDIALQVIKQFGQKRSIVLLGDPHVIKKLLEEGIEQGCNWSEYTISVIVGGVWFSDSFAEYVLRTLNQTEEYEKQTNKLFSTMGVTEVGLNIFAATPDLVYARSLVQRDPVLLNQLSSDGNSCPILMYQLSQSVYVEVVDQDEKGVGDLVVTHLTEESVPCLVRYKTGDRVRALTPVELQTMGIIQILPFPVFAIYGRSLKSNQSGLTEAGIKQYLYQDAAWAAACTGHFFSRTRSDDMAVEVLVQMKENTALPSARSFGTTLFTPVPYKEFPRDMEVTYERKWTHFG